MLLLLILYVGSMYLYIAIGCNCIFIINRLDQSLIYIYTYPLPYYKTKMYVFHLKKNTNKILCF